MATADPMHLTPPRSGRGATGASLALAVTMHCLLFSFLYFGIRWQNRPPVAVEAELWREPPRVVEPAARPTPEPPRPVVREEPKPEPAPAKPDIAIKDEKKKPEPKKEEKPKPEVKKEDKPRDDPLKRALEREEMERKLAQEARRDEMAQKAASETSAAGQKASRDWNDRVSAKVRSKVPSAVASAVTGNPEAVFEVRLLPSLEVESVRMTKSSGNPPYDEAAERAIKAASPLPPATGDRFTPPRVLNLRMRPKDE